MLKSRKRAPLFVAAALAMTLLVHAQTHAGNIDAPPVASGLVLFGSIVPALTLLPVMNGVGVPSSFPTGPDVVSGFDVHGRRLFARSFRDRLYNFYVFVELDRSKIQALHRLRLKIRGQSLERAATRHGLPAAQARLVGVQRVRIRWDARAFPRLSCHDEGDGSPAPLMLGGDFTAADVRGGTLRCDFSDGVKTVYANVLLRIEPAASRN